MSTSRFGFRVLLAKTAVQGEGAPSQIAAAIEALDVAGVDIICLVRGGGSRGDLACFDDERVARAVATARTPVFTGIGHTGDESVADLAAHTRAITPTKLGEEIVALVSEWQQRNVRRPAQRILAASEATLDESTEYVGERRRTMIFAVRDRLRGEYRHLGTTRERLAVQQRQLLQSSTHWLQASRQLLGAYDPKRRQAQGWSIVTGRSGRVIRATGDVLVGEAVRIGVSDGWIGATVGEIEQSGEEK